MGLGRAERPPAAYALVFAGGACAAWACLADAIGLPVPTGAGRVLKRPFIFSTQPAKVWLSAEARLKSATPRRPSGAPDSATRRASGLLAFS